MIAAFALLFVIFIESAVACGGFFCNAVQQPTRRVDQDGENILFSMENGLITATIQIRYSGPTNDFSWILPLPTDPSKFEVASDQLFRTLHQQTDPTFSFLLQKNDSCFGYPCTFASQAFLPGAFSTVANDATVKGVNLIAQGEVGPYMYQVIVALESDTNGDALFQWLTDNKFEIPESSRPIVARYVKYQHRFVTLKMLKGKESGDLVPIVIEYKSPLDTVMSCVPLRLTKIAAKENMPIFVWIAGSSRAVPQNFVHLKPDLSQLPWLTCAQTASSPFGGFPRPTSTSQSFFPAFGSLGACTVEYQQLLRDTANSFGATKWLTTEFAGSISSSLIDAIWSDNMFDVNEFAKYNDAVSFLNALIPKLPVDLQGAALTQQIIKKYIPKPANVAAQCQQDAQFYSTSSGCISSDTKVDGAAFAKDIKTTLIQPIIDSRDRLKKFKYITRLFTTISPENMVRDPIFRFVDGLPDVSNQHNAVFNLDCPTAEVQPYSSTFTTGSLSVDGLPALKYNNVSYQVCSNFVTNIGNPTPDYTAATLELLQAADDKSTKLMRKTFTKKDEIIAIDATLAESDVIVGPKITCNAGSRGCLCMDGMCGAGLECRLVMATNQKICYMKESFGSSANSNRSSTIVVALLLLLLIAIYF